MKKLGSSLLAGVSVLVLSSAAHAQQQPAAPQPDAEASEGGAATGDIVVTARRRSETLQEVPQTVNVVTDQALQDFAITNFEDISDLVPGLSLESGVGGYRSNASVRGVEFSIEGQASGPTTAFYINEAPIDANLVFQAQYDLGQIEVLKGPQGTDRGVSSPSGAFTIATRSADPAGGITGYVGSTIDDHDGINLQGAINIPIIEDIFAMRIAGLRDTNDGNGVESVTSSRGPHEETQSYRVSFTLTPTDNFRARAMFQEVTRESFSYGSAQYGPGECAEPFGTVPTGARCTAANADPTQPQITMGQYANVSDNFDEFTQVQQIATVNLEYSLLGQQLSYVGGWSNWNTDSRGDGDEYNFVRQLVPYSGGGPIDDGRGQTVYTHELRLQSEEPLFNGFLDYTVGVYSQELEGKTFFPSPTTRNAGSFGAFNAIDPNVFNINYSRFAWTYSERNNSEKSLFGSVNLHLTDALDLTIGGRQIIAERNQRTRLQQGGFFDPASESGPRPSLRNVACGTPNSVPSQYYPGTCDVISAAAPATVFGRPVADETRPEVYNVSLSYDINDDIMVYATHGTSWRDGPAFVTGGPGTNCADVAYCTPYIDLNAETSRLYEVGVKAYFMDRRGYFEASFYEQEFDGFILRGNSARYLNNAVPLPANPPTGTWTYNADVVVSGFDVLARFDITDNWNVGFSASYNDGEFNGATNVPCNDSNFDGIPDNGTITSADWVNVFGGPPGPALCPAVGSSNSTTPWSANLRSEYNFPVFGTLRGFLRGNYNFYPENENVDPGDDFIVDSYGILNLFAGIRAEDRTWEVTAFVRNVLDEDTITRDSTAVDNVSGQSWAAPNRGFTVATNPNYFGSNGVQYGTFTRVAEREMGVTLRYNF